ncbi:MAG: AAA-like domain-containing protein [Lachnospiraceae bacterium]|nr:AAA-like domain-containing protein [Lachnospiraceae bacterium]
MKEFNITGICIPEKHYMVDISDKIERITSELVDKGKYFTLNRARQYGKTTTLNLLSRNLRQNALVISLSFEGADDYFRSMQHFVRGISLDIADILETERAADELVQVWRAPVDEELPLRQLSKRITALCNGVDRDVVLMIDEVDKSSDNQIFLSFLGMLRDKYLKREQGRELTFRSVILAGVYDIRNMKLKLRDEEEHKYNSPWNIAVPFDMDMSFATEGIVAMLEEYEAEHGTGMALWDIADEISYYTSGYPFLVSYICMKLDRQNTWSVEAVRYVVRDMLKENNTLFDDVIKNVRNHKAFAKLTENIILLGAPVPFDIHNPEIYLGVMFGIYADKNDKVAVSNVIFETLILNYFTTIRLNTALLVSDYSVKEQYIQEGKLNMEHILRQFSSFLYSEYRDEDALFIEQQGRLLFLCFLRPVINGTGHYAVDPQTRQNDRMDIQVFYGGEEYVIELKVWRGIQYEKKGYDQLCDYLDARGLKKGYLLSFCGNHIKPREDSVFEYRGHEICEVIAAYRADR